MFYIFSPLSILCVFEIKIPSEYHVFVIDISKIGLSSCIHLHIVYTSFCYPHTFFLSLSSEQSDPISELVPFDAKLMIQPSREKSDLILEGTNLGRGDGKLSVVEGQCMLVWLFLFAVKRNVVFVFFVQPCIEKKTPTLVRLNFDYFKWRVSKNVSTSKHMILIYIQWRFSRSVCNGNIFSIQCWRLWKIWWYFVVITAKYVFNDYALG